ncbi:MAG TPA: HEAT repeat domain-containing protein [Spirochaetota bacterium]|nr:HEAT repeat domain-containing protein [Spirochaetota bacterium]
MVQITKYIITILAAALFLFAATGIYAQTTAADDTNKTATKVKKDNKAADSKAVTGKPDDKKTTDTKNGDKSKTDDKSKQDKKAKEPADENKKAGNIETTLKFGIQKDRKIAINQIKNIQDKTIQKKLTTLLLDIIQNDNDMEIRKTAITVIGDLKVEGAGAALIKALDDESEDVQIAACFAIGRIKAAEAKPKLIEMIKKQDLTKDSNLTDAIITALDELGASELAAFAVEAVKDTKNSKIAREKLLLFIGKNGSAAQKDFLLEIYKDDEQEMIMRSYAVKSIAKLKLNEAAPDIKAVIREIDSFPFGKKKKYYDLYINSVAALAEMGDKEAIPLLMDSLRSDNTNVRLKALRLLKDFNDERTIDIIKYKMNNDPSNSVRKAARKILEEKGIIEKTKEEDYKGIEESTEDKEDQREQ